MFAHSFTTRCFATRGRLAPLLVALVLALASARCINGSGTAPAPTPTAAPPDVTAMAVTGAGAAVNPGQTSQLTATATYSDGTIEPVTDRAAWSSTNTAIATVSATGVATFVAVGEVEIRATFKSVTGMARVTVDAVQAVKYDLTGRLTDRDNNRGVENVRVEVTDGPDVQRSATTDVDGRYTLSSLSPGTVTVRITNPKYEPVTRAVTLTGPTRLDVALVPIPVAPPAPPAIPIAAYGTYAITLTVTAQDCSTPVVPGPAGTLKLEGKADGTGVTVTIVERGTSRTYKSGKLEVDGRFSAVGSGLIAGIMATATTGPGVDRHDFTGSVSGRVSGRTIQGSEKITYGAPCPGGTATIAFTGSK